MTKDEFGIDLLDAIMCCGGILQLQQLREKTRPKNIKPRQLHEWQLKERELFARVTEVFASLSDEDAAELSRRYPFMLSQ